jgi:hypothetical protein
MLCEDAVAAIDQGTSSPAPYDKISMFSLSEEVRASMTLDCQDTNCLRGLNNRMNMPFDHLQEFAKNIRLIRKENTALRSSYHTLSTDATRPDPVVTF